MNKTVVSILMPVHNVASTIHECIESIIQQTVSHFELIVVDDGSSDSSKTLLEDYARSDKRIKLISTPQQGIVKALNLGLQHCNGNYIARMDGDDVMHPQRLEKQVEFLEQHPELGLIGSLVQGIPQTTQYQQWSNSLVTNESIREEIFVESPIMHPTFFAKHELFEQLGGYCAHPWAEDYDFLLRAYQLDVRFGKVNDFLVKKRDSLTRLSRVDWRYKRPAMFKAKVHYFLKMGFLENKKGVVIAGTGPSGRKIASIFQKQSIPVLGFVDNHPGPPDRTVMDIPAYGFTEDQLDRDLPDFFLERFKNMFIISAVGNEEGRSQLQKLLDHASGDIKTKLIRFI